MSCIIEGSLEILRPVAPVERKGDDCASRTQLLEASTDDENEVEEEESDDFDKDGSDSFMDEASGSDEEDELLAEERRERATPIAFKEKWRSKCELLQQYKQENGHCRVPRCYEIDGMNLGSWLNNQRVEYKKHCEGKPAYITQERIEKLKAVGLDFNDTMQKRYEAQWQSKLELLREYREQHGHCRVPHSYAINGVKLGNWLNYLRTEYKKHSGGKPAKISQERINALNAIGLEWFPRNLTRTRVASTAGQSIRTTPIANCSLRKRAALIVGRSNYTVPERSSPKLHCGKRKRTTPERLVLDPPRNQATVTNETSAKVKASSGGKSRSVTYPSSRRTVSERPKSANNIAIESMAKAKAAATDTQWDEHFDRLVEFKWNHGHSRVPVDFCVDDSYYLGQWVVVQRLQHNRLMDGRASSITAKQVERLNAIDFVWKVR